MKLTEKNVRHDLDAVLDDLQEHGRSYYDEGEVRCRDIRAACKQLGVQVVFKEQKDIYQSIELVRLRKIGLGH